MFVDVHAHLIHPKFTGEEDAVALRAKQRGLEYVIVNGLEPVSNRQVLELCARHDHLLPALGIYPLDAMANEIHAHNTWQHPFPAPVPFDVDAEIEFIASQARNLVAIGEIGLDNHWVKDHPQAQERVFRKLVAVAQEHDLPIIIHSRKTELKCFEILKEMGVTKADFHCYGGKLKLAKQIANAGYYLSIPPVVVKAESFQRIAQELPLAQLLTETDCPYMGPVSGERNEPANVPVGVEAMAKARGMSTHDMAVAIRENFKTLFGL